MEYKIKFVLIRVDIKQVIPNRELLDPTGSSIFAREELRKEF